MCSVKFVLNLMHKIHFLYTILFHFFPIHKLPKFSIFNNKEPM